MSKLKKALEKAKQARAAENHVFRQEPQWHEVRPPLAPRKEESPTKRREVDVTYRDTRVLDIDPHVLRKNKIFSHFHENEMTDQLKILRTQVLGRLKEMGGNSLLVTSANPGEGKTFTSINLAISISQELDRTVLLVDGDLRHPTRQHFDFAQDFLGIDIDYGLSDYLMGEAELPDLMLNPGIHRLTILPAGNSLPNSSELLGSPRMESLVEEMKSRYRGDRIIIFDCSALLVSSDPVVLSRFLDGILLVVETERTSPDDLKRALALVEKKKLIGTVMNKAYA